MYRFEHISTTYIHLFHVKRSYLVRMWSAHPSASTARHMRPPFFWYGFSLARQVWVRGIYYKQQNKTKQFNTLSESRYNSQGSELFQIYMTYQLLEQFLWRHMKSHSVNNLKTDKRTGQILFKITLSSCKVNFFDKKQQKSTIYIKIVKHLSSTVFGTFIICSISAVVLFIFWVLLTRRWSCSQYRENGLQDWAQELLLQHSLWRLEKYTISNFASNFYIPWILKLCDTPPISIQ